VVTHDMRMAREISDHVVFLHQGLVEEQGASEQIFVNPKSERLRGFLSATVPA
jgi:polar amino acid transport system ATP-binding protein